MSHVTLFNHSWFNLFKETELLESDTSARVKLQRQKTHPDKPSKRHRTKQCGDFCNIFSIRHMKKGRNLRTHLKSFLVLLAIIIASLLVSIHFKKEWGGVFINSK